MPAAANQAVEQLALTIQAPNKPTLTRTDDAVTTPTELDRYLHTQIDSYRALLNSGKPKTAYDQFKAMLDSLPGSASQHILFRIKANIGHCLMRLDREGEAADWLSEAWSHSPDEPKAIANKALSLLLSNDFEGAVSFATEALQKDTDNEYLASYYVQAASHIDRIADPMQQVPPGLRERPLVMLADVVFHRNRGNEENWIARARRACARHPDEPSLKLFAAEAEIAEICRAGAYQYTHQLTVETKQRLLSAAHALQAAWDKVRVSEIALGGEVVLQTVSAMIGWHLARESEKACAIAEQLIALKVSHRFAITNATQILAENGRADLNDQIAALAPDLPEVRWLQGLAQINAGDWDAAARIFRSGELPETERALAQTFIALAPLKNKDAPVDPGQLENFLTSIGDDIRSLIVFARITLGRGHTDYSRRAFDKARSLIGPTTHIAARIMTAQHASDIGNASVVIDLLDSVVPRDEDTRELFWLAEAHAREQPKRQRNKTFFELLPEALRQTPKYARLFGSVLLDAGGGHLKEVIDLYDSILAAEADDAFSMIRLAEAYERQENHDGIAELARRIDPAALQCHSTLRISISHILRNGGRFPEALDLAYEAVRDAPKNPQVALGYVGLILGDRTERIIPSIDVVGRNAYVELEGPYGERQKFVIEDGEGFRGIDTRPFDHELVQRFLGKRLEDAETFPSAGGTDVTWTVKVIKSKYLHLLHEVMDDFERRFEGFDGLYSVKTKDEDIGPILESVRLRAIASQNMARNYYEGRLPLDFVAQMAGGDVLSFASYIRELGKDIGTCRGTHAERAEAIALAGEWRSKGAALDTYTAAVAAQLDILPVLKDHFGTVFVAQSSIDILQALVKKQKDKLGRGAMAISWHNGQYYRHTDNDAEVQATIDQLQRMISRIEVDATVNTVLLPDHLSDEMVSISDKIGAAPFHAMHLAAQCNAILISDDALYRLLAHKLVNAPGLWLQPALISAAKTPRFTRKLYLRAIVGLAAHRHGHVGVGTVDLVEAYTADTDDLSDFQVLATRLGGASADLRSHADVVEQVLRYLWRKPSANTHRRAKATGHLLSNVVRGRPNDYHLCLAYIAECLDDCRLFIDYLNRWIAGHFLAFEEIRGAYQYLALKARREVQISELRWRPAVGLYS